MKKINIILSLLLISLLFSTCTNASATQYREAAAGDPELIEDTTPDETNITIDGDPSDWEKLERLNPNRLMKPNQNRISAFQHTVPVQIL